MANRVIRRSLVLTFVTIAGCANRSPRMFVQLTDKPRSGHAAKPDNRASIFITVTPNARLTLGKRNAGDSFQKPEPYFCGLSGGG
jgi:hypothetical protein